MQSIITLIHISPSLTLYIELLGEENDVEWSRLVDRVSASLAPVEERVAAKLKAQITDAKTPLALETEFRRYSELMRREAIKQMLRAERQSLLAAYADLIGRYICVYTLTCACVYKGDSFIRYRCSGILMAEERESFIGS